MSDTTEERVRAVLPCVCHTLKAIVHAPPGPGDEHYWQCPAHKRPAVLALLREVDAEPKPTPTRQEATEAARWLRETADYNTSAGLSDWQRERLRSIASLLERLGGRE